MTSLPQLHLYNTLTRSKEVFQPLQPGQVQMYCCGVTVYDYCHVGHARSYMVWDVVRRYLAWLGYQVRYVQNFTDIDDKILNRAREEGSSMQAVAERYTQAYFEDMRRLNVVDADEYTYATHTIDGIQRLIHELEQRGFAYAAEGDVYYRVHQFPTYGKLSGRKFEEMQAGASGRVDRDPEAPKKEHPFDFALWKAAKPGEPSWPSPWGQGRPGWHIECSAMVRDRLGDSIDIHMGGADLIFPHHENEIAQSEAATGKPLARYWLHNGMVMVNGEKMSKSLGNFITIRQLLDRGMDPMVLRLFVLQAHYRKPLDFTEEALASAQNAWQTLKDSLQFLPRYEARLATLSTKDTTRQGADPGPEFCHRFNSAMDDDFNTPEALVVVFEIAKELRRNANLIVHEGRLDMQADLLRQHHYTLVALAKTLGLELLEPEQLPQTSPAEISEAEVSALIQQRKAAKQAKNWGESDRIRADLGLKGITLIDQPGGITRWESTWGTSGIG